VSATAAARAGNAGREASGCENCLLSSYSPRRSGRNLPQLVGCTKVSFYVFLSQLGTDPVLSTHPFSVSSRTCKNLIGLNRALYHALIRSPARQNEFFGRDTSKHSQRASSSPFSTSVYALFDPEPGSWWIQQRGALRWGSPSRRGAARARARELQAPTHGTAVKSGDIRLTPEGTQPARNLAIAKPHRGGRIRLDAA